MNQKLAEEAIQYHEKYKGKIGTSLLAPLNNKEDLSLAYSPGVGAVTLAISENNALAGTLTLKGRTVGIISDGSAILGLGNLGALPALPVMEGKAALLKHFANVDAFPITLNTQDPDEIINIILNIQSAFGAINLEDFSAPRCFYIEEELRKRASVPVMHDDQWGTATVVLAGLINSLKLAGKELKSVRIVIAGIGAAGVAVSRLLLTAEAKNLIFVDSKGIVTEDREDLSKEKKELLNGSMLKPSTGGLKDALIEADVFIGLSLPNTVDADMIKNMNTKPIIFALANPIPEIMPDVAIKAGAFIIATGRSDFPNQVNNALVFPGVLKAAIETPNVQFENHIFLKCAYALADSVKELRVDYIIPSPFDETVVKTVYETAKLEFLKQK